MPDHRRPSERVIHALQGLAVYSPNGAQGRNPAFRYSERAGANIRLRIVCNQTILMRCMTFYGNVL